MGDYYEFVILGDEFWVVLRVWPKEGSENTEPSIHKLKLTPDQHKEMTEVMERHDQEMQERLRHYFYKETPMAEGADITSGALG